MKNQLHVYSIATARLTCLAGPDRAPIQRATGFYLRHKERILLITNDHVVSGLGHGDRKILSDTGAIPNWLQVKGYAPENPNYSSTVPTNFVQVNFLVPLYKDTDACLDPRWISHPTLGHQVDVVAIDMTDMFEKIQPARPATLEFPDERTKYRPMERVFVVGFPLDEEDSPNLYPIYKAASVASEPDFLGPRPYVLIDGKTRSGMSGSPVILEHSVKLTDQDDGTMQFSSGATELIGVYSGRESESQTTFEAELGLMWPYRIAIEPLLNSVT